MGKLHLLKGSWDGRVGETVGSKWKNLSTIRTYAKPTYTRTPAQDTVRSAFAILTAIFATFALALKPLTSLNTKGMSVRNALIKLNKSLMATASPPMAEINVSKGGVLMPTFSTATEAAATGLITATVAAPAGVQLSTKAQFILVVYNDTKKTGTVGQADATGTSVTATLAADTGDSVHSWVYLLDWRGNTKVSSNSIYKLVTVS